MLPLAASLLLWIPISLSTASSTSPSCAIDCYNVGTTSTFNCGFGNFTCYCQPPASDTYLTCVEDTCDKADLPSAVQWAKKNCAGYDFRADGTFASFLATITAAATTSATAASAGSSSSSFSSTSSSKLASTIVGSASAQRSSSSGTRASPKRSSTASATQTSSSSSSSSSAKASNGGLSTSDIIAVAVGVPGSIATVVGTFFVVKAYLRKRKALRKQER